MRAKPIITHTTPVGGNIFADLGFEPIEAARLLAEADARISQIMASKEAGAREVVREGADTPK